MKFGLYCNWNLHSYNGSYYIDSADYKYLVSICCFSSEIQLLTSVKDAPPPVNYRLLDLESVSIKPIPFFSSYLNSWSKFFDIYKGIKSLLSFSEFVYIRTPEPFSWLVLLFSRRNKIINFHYASNPLQVIISNTKQNIILRYIKYSIFLPEFYLISIAAYFCSVSSNGKSVLGNIPFYLKRKLNVSYESTLTALESTAKKSRNILNSPTVSFLSVGRLQPGKGLFEMLEAFSLLKRENPSFLFKLSVVGDGPLKNALLDAVESLGLIDEVEFYGAITNGPKLESVYDAHDVFIMPSLSETGPRVLIEAMHSSEYCISSNVGYVSEVLDDTCAHILPPGSISALHGALVWVYENRVEARSRASLAFVRVGSYTIDKFFVDIVRGIK